MSEQEKPEFTGILDTDYHNKVALILDVYHRNPLVHDALKVLRSTGVRGRDRLTLEKKKDTGRYDIFPRSFESVTDHQAVAMLSADSVADLVGLSPDERNLLVGNALMHDSDKYLEIQMLGLRGLKGQKDEAIRERSRKFVAESMIEFGITDSEDEAYALIDSIVDIDDVLQFHSRFDEVIKIPMIRERLQCLNVTEDQRNVVLKLNGADSVGQMPLLLARSRAFIDEIPEDDATNKVKRICEALRSQGDLPVVAGNTIDFMALLTLYCDGTTVWNTVLHKNSIGLVEKRIEDIIQRGAYAELDESFKGKYGFSYWETALAVQMVIERLIKKRGVENGKIDLDVEPRDIPIVVFENLQERIP